MRGFFYRCGGRLRSECQSCTSRLNHEYRQQNRERLRAYFRAYHQTHREQRIAYLRERNSKRLWFRGRDVHLDFVPRTGTCFTCGRSVGREIKRTLLHHTRYDPAHPTAYTVELCVGCHTRLHRAAA